MKSGTHKAVNRESTKLTNKELTDLWEVPTPEGNSTSGAFRPEEIAAAESLRVWILPCSSLYSIPGRLSNLGFVISSLPACANSNFQ